MKRVKIVSVIVSYNPYRYGFFPACVQDLKKTVLQNDKYQIDHHILVVDNASTDEAPALVRQQFPGVEVIETGKNLGYAGGNNVGIKEALRRGTQYVAVVTQDVFVHPDWLLRLVDTAEAYPGIGAVQPLICLAQERDKINSIGNKIHFLGYGYADGYRLNRAEFLGAGIKPVAYASGACLLLTARALSEVGLFDEEMWMYNEDEDLGWRMWLNGYKQVLAPKSVVYHQYEFSRSISKMYYMDRNRLLVLFQNYHWGTLLLIAPALLANELASLLFALVGGWWREKLAVWRYFLKAKHWRLLFEKRRLRQANRVMKERQIAAMFTGRILFQDIRNPLVLYVGNPLLAFYWAVVRRCIFW